MIWFGTDNCEIRRHSLLGVHATGWDDYYLCFPTFRNYIFISEMLLGMQVTSTIVPLSMSINIKET